MAYKLTEALLRERGAVERAHEYLDAVALGTIADVVPLVGENRVLARLGLDRLNRGGRLGPVFITLFQPGSCPHPIPSETPRSTCVRTR